MRTLLLTTLVALVPALSANAQIKMRGPKPASSAYELEVLGFARQEWTTRQYSDVTDDKRWQLRLFPRIEIGRDWFFAGVGGDFTHGSVKNVEGVPPSGTYAENYDTRAIRLDLAYVRITPLSWLRVEGGRFVMPVPLTEMIWDSDLKPQGGALTLDFKPRGDLSRVTLTALAARGSHVFDDVKTNMVLLSATGELKGGGQSKLALTASVVQYTDYNDLDGLDPRLFRQNTRGVTGLAPQFRVVDLQARVSSAGRAPAELLVDYCFNTQADEARSGLWLGVRLGALPQSRARWEYVYARIDRDATLAAYNTDDFIWHTDWEGHRGELAIGTGQTSSLHVIGQLQRPRHATQPDGTRPWVRRLRVEWHVDISSR